MKAISLLGCGMVTSVGLNAPSACAAMRAGLTSFSETRYCGLDGEWLMGSPVPLSSSWRGIAKLAHLIAPALRECLSAIGSIKPDQIPILLCVAEKDRPGRLDGIEKELLPEIESLLGCKFHPQSRLVARGRMGGAEAIELARQLIHEHSITHCIVAGVDSFLVGETVASYLKQFRLLTAANSDGFIPGEAGAAILLGKPTNPAVEFQCHAIGFGKETATMDSDQPLRSDGLVEAFRNLLLDGGQLPENSDYRITDCNGEQYWFKSDRLAISRTFRKLKSRYDHLHPADSVGEIGAAIVPCVLGMAYLADRKGYAPGRRVLCHFSNDDGSRAAMIWSRQEKENSHGK